MLRQALADAFLLDLDQKQWTPVPTALLPQEPRAGHALVLAPGEATLLMFGGGDNNGRFYSAVHTITVADLLQLV